MKGTIYMRAIVILLLFGCEESSTLLPAYDETNLLAVESVLTNENKNQLVKLSLPHTAINGYALPATGAVVRIFEGNSPIDLVETPPGSGEYLTPPMRAVFGKLYTLHIIYEGKEFVGQDSSVPVEPMNPLQYERVDQSDPFHYQLLPAKSGTEPNYIRHDISWSNTPQCKSGESCNGLIIYYDLKTADVNEILKPDKSEFSIPVKATVIRTKYSLSNAFKTYLRSLLSETEWRGSFFDVQRANGTTNMKEVTCDGCHGVVGFFAVTSVTSDTTKIEVIP